MPLWEKKSKKKIKMEEKKSNHKKLKPDIYDVAI
jgi:hypothetical protein